MLEADDVGTRNSPREKLFWQLTPKKKRTIHVHFLTFSFTLQIASWSLRKITNTSTRKCHREHYREFRELERKIREKNRYMKLTIYFGKIERLFFRNWHVNSRTRIGHRIYTETRTRNYFENENFTSIRNYYWKKGKKKLSKIRISGLGKCYSVLPDDDDNDDR